MTKKEANQIIREHGKRDTVYTTHVQSSADWKVFLRQCKRAVNKMQQIPDASVNVEFFNYLATEQAYKFLTREISGKFYPCPNGYDEKLAEYESIKNMSYRKYLRRYGELSVQDGWFCVDFEFSGIVFAGLSQRALVEMEVFTKDGCEIIYQEKKSAFSQRPELDQAIKSLRPGDTLCVWSFDRLGRNMLEVMSNIKTIHDKGANVYSVIQKIDTDTPAGKMMLFNFTLFAEMEATLRRERAQAGIAIAREQGRPTGRPEGMTPKTIAIAPLVRQMYLSIDPFYSVSQITKNLKISKKTNYRCLDFERVQLKGGIVNIKPQ